MKVKVKAKRMGYFDGRRIAEGEVFECEKKLLGSWMEIIKAKPQQEKALEGAKDEKAKQAQDARDVI